MAKEDAPTPERPPSKRRQLEQCLDVWIAVWAADAALTPSERRRAQEERDRRKVQRARVSTRVGLVIGPEGVTPPQRAAIIDAIPETAGAIHFNGPLLPSKIALLGIPTEYHEDPRDAVKESDLVLVAPRAEGVLIEVVRYARHRKVAVLTVLPNGETQ